MELSEAPVTEQVKHGFKKTEVGEIPLDWSDPRLIDIVRDDSPICYGLVQVGAHVSDGVPVLAIKDLNGDYVSGVHRSAPAIERVYIRSRVRSGDVLISVKGTTGRVGTVPQSFIGNISRDLARLRLKEEVASTYCAQMLQSALAQKRIATVVVGTTRQELSIAALRDIRIPLPPSKDEQDTIATALSDVDGLLAGLDALIAKKKAIKQGAMQQLLTGKQRLPGFKGEWVVASIEEVAKRITGFWGSGEENADTPKRARIIRAGDVSADGKLTATAERFLSDAAFLTAKCDRGDVVITVSGNGLGKVWLCDGRPDVCVSNFVRALKPRKQLAGAYLYYQLCSSRAQQLLVEYTATSAYPNLRPNFFGVSWLPLPTLEEQTAIAEVLSDMDAELGALEARRVKTALLKQGMMQELLTGRTRLV
ncbi:MAG: restriction endonuclease subunit S [Flavobacteriales bacterium]|nr:restriction endonuclease subunit S [Flavobacteriales bacterium]